MLIDSSTISYLPLWLSQGPVAHLVERGIRIAEVRSPSLLRSTNCVLSFPLRFAKGIGLSVLLRTLQAEKREGAAIFLKLDLVDVRWK